MVAKINSAENLNDDELTPYQQRMAEAGVSAAQYQDATGTPPPTAVDTLKQQILSQNTTSQWTGEGYGSAQANAEAMAKLLSDAGITNINQLAVRKEVVPYMAGEWGEIPEHTVSKYYNKETGKEISSGTGRWQNQGGEGLFGGTGEGKGNTGFRVNFADDGTPIFYTTKGSSSDAGAIMPLIQIGLAATGAGGLLGNALLGTGASQVAASALGNAILGGATTGLAGGDALKGALLGGAGGALGGYLKGANAVTLGDASDIAMKMADAGVPLTEIETALTNSGFSPSVVADSLKDAANAMSPMATNVPIDGSSLVDTFNVVAPSVAPSISTNALTNILSQVPNIVTTGAKTPEQVSPDILNAVTSLLNSNLNTATPKIEVKATNPNKFEVPVITPITSTLPIATPPTVKVTETNPNKTDNSAPVPLIAAPITTNLPTVPELVMTENAPKTQQDQIQAPLIVAPPIDTTLPTPNIVVTGDRPIIKERPSSITDELAPLPLIVAPPIDTTLPTKKTDLTASDVVKLIGAATTIAAINAKPTTPTNTSNQYPIVDVPPEWTSPVNSNVVPSTSLPAIDFGSRDLLRGTQWEKFLDPNYGKVPQPIQYSQPSKLSYSDLMDILGSKQGMPSKSSLSINDIISGIQNQYGQTPSGSMG